MSKKDKVKELLRQGMKQTEIQKIVGVSQPYVSMVKKSMLADIAKGLGDQEQEGEVESKKMTPPKSALDKLPIRASDAKRDTKVFHLQPPEVQKEKTKKTLKRSSKKSTKPEKLKCWFEIKSTSLGLLLQRLLEDPECELKVTVEVNDGKD